MRDYGRVYSAFWQSPEIRTLPEDARTLALYLLTTPHGNLIGCFRLPDAYAAEDLQWSSERVAKGFAQLCSVEFITRDEATKWLCIAKYVKWNAFENPNVAKAAHKAFGQVPDMEVKSLLALALLEFGVHMSPEFSKDCETLVELFRIPEPEPEPIRTRARTVSRTTTKPEPLSAGVADATPTAEHGNNGKALKPKTADTWEAYASAYRDRYGAEPVRNAAVNGQLSNLVGKLGEEAPAVARFYVGHNRSDYVKAMHDTALLCRDASGLRTQWATQRTVTTTQANQADMTQTNFNAFAPMLAEARAKEAEDAQRAAA